MLLLLAFFLGGGYSIYINHTLNPRSSASTLFAQEWPDSRWEMLSQSHKVKIEGAVRAGGSFFLGGSNGRGRRACWRFVCWEANHRCRLKISSYEALIGGDFCQNRTECWVIYDAETTLLRCPEIPKIKIRSAVPCLVFGGLFWSTLYWANAWKSPFPSSFKLIVVWGSRWL